jgi:hypothetical protein
VHPQSVLEQPWTTKKLLVSWSPYIVRVTYLFRAVTQSLQCFPNGRQGDLKVMLRHEFVLDLI